jgi:hypothetical protein
MTLYTKIKRKNKMDNYIQYLDTACELAKVDKVQIIEMVRNKKSEFITNLLD